jgi:hypothetical protein
MLIPKTRKVVANWVRRLIQRKIQQRETRYWEIH